MGRCRVHRVFWTTVQTNNDVEDWHCHLNNRAIRGQLQLYMLIPLLHREASILPLQVKLVNERETAATMSV